MAATTVAACVAALRALRDAPFSSLRRLSSVAAHVSRPGRQRSTVPALPRSNTPAWPRRDEGAAAKSSEAPLYDEVEQVIEAITRSLAPAGATNVSLPASEVEDLQGLYDALTSPLPQPPSREERTTRYASVDTEPGAFWRRHTPSVESYAYLVRCRGVQLDLAGAHAAFDQMEASGLIADTTAYAALMDACAKSADVGAAEAVLERIVGAGVKPDAPIYTGLMQASARPAYFSVQLHVIKTITITTHPRHKHHKPTKKLYLHTWPGPGWPEATAACQRIAPPSDSSNQRSTPLSDAASLSLTQHPYF